MRIPILRGLLGLGLFVWLMAPVEASAHAKHPNRLLCVDTPKGPVTCYLRQPDEPVRRLTDVTLEAVLKHHALSGTPFLYLDKNSRTFAGFLADPDQTVSLHPLNIRTPDDALRAEPWFLPFWYALDDAHWVRFAQDIAARDGAGLGTDVLEAIQILSEVPVPEDGEADGAITEETLSETQAPTAASPLDFQALDLESAIWAGVFDDLAPLQQGVVDGDTRP